MQIDWFTFLAQIINFLILLYLLRRFLYGPIIETMDKREEKISARLQEAEQKRSEAEEQQQRYRQQRRELEEQRDKQLADVQKEIESRRKELMAEAHDEVQEKKQDWREALRREQDVFVRELSQRVGHEAGEIARRALQDMADVQVEQRVADLFVARIEELEPAERAEISESIQESGLRVVIRSAFELPGEMQQRIADSVRLQILDGKDPVAEFETSPDLISGIEMQVDGYQVVWSIKDYLGGLEAQIRRTIEEEGQKRRGDEHGP